MEALDVTFTVVADYFSIRSEPNRLKILHALSREEKSVIEVMDKVVLSQTSVSHFNHLHKMRAIIRHESGLTAGGMANGCRLYASQVKLINSANRVLKNYCAYQYFRCSGSQNAYVRLCIFRFFAPSRLVLAALAKFFNTLLTRTPCSPRPANRKA